MKKQLLSLAFAGLLPFAPALAQLTYTQVTHAGLTTVTFEMGYTELEVGDVDGDGDLDIVTIGDHGSPNINATEGGIMVFKNGGTGQTWTLSKSGSFGYGGVALGDVNNDGKMDVGYAMHHNYSSTDFGNQLIEVALGNGTGSSWTPYDDSLATNGETYGMFGIDFADVDNDGLLDLASNSFGCCSGIHVYKNDGNGHWTQTDGANAGNSYEWVKFGDFNNDGKVDMVSSNELGFIWKNNGSGVFASFETGFTNDWYNWVDVGDFNNDGAKDLAIINSNGAAEVWYYDGAAASWKKSATGLPTSGATGIAMEHMDMDGHADLVVWSALSITIFKGDGAGNWTQAGSITIPESQLSSITTGDFDHDGYGDIAYLARTSVMNADNYLRIYLHNNSTVANLGILPVNPKGFECFMPGSVQFINWVSSVPAGPAATVTIEFSSAGNSGPWSPVVSNAPNNGTYQWIVPNVNSSNCYLKFTISNGSATQSVVISNAFGVSSCVSSPTGIQVQALEALSFSIYPNPMVSEGYAHFALETSGEVQLDLLDLSGKVIANLMSGTYAAGFYNPAIPINKLKSGVYLCRLNYNGLEQVSMVVVTR